MNITTGKYKARLYDAVRSMTPDGKHNVTFVWDIVGLDARVSNTVCLADDYGRPDAVASWEVEQWAKGWDRRDLDWFANQIKQGKSINAWVSTTEGKVDAVFPRIGGEVEKVGGGGQRNLSSSDKVESTSDVHLDSPPPPRYYSNKPTIIKLEIDQEALAQMPAQIEPTFVNAKTLYDAITERTENREDANLVWTLMAAKIGPMQIDFTSVQWGEMIERIRQLKSCSFVVRNRRVDYSTLRAEEK